MQAPQSFALDTATAAEATFRMNYFPAERREYHRTFCAAMIRFSLIGFAEAVRRAAGMDPAQVLDEGLSTSGR